MAGHVHVIAGDVTRLACDAWLLPTDGVFRISGSFAPAIGVDAGSCLDGLAWNGSRVVRLPGDNHLGRVWLGDVGRWQAEPDWYADVVDPFVAAASAALRAKLDGRRPVLAVNVVGTGEGGMEADKGAIHEALLPALYQAAARYDADLVLVCWQRRSYSAAQRVRRRLLERRCGGDLATLWDLGNRGEALAREARRIAGELRRRNLVLFVGAGVSAGAGLPAWQGLLDGIAESLGAGGPSRDRLRQLDVRDQAAVLQRRLSATGRTLHQAIAERVDRTRYALIHGQLASLATREAVTTNYDQLFEAAASAVDGSIAVLPYEPVQPDQRWLLKLHGSIDRDDSIVFTRSDYITVPDRHSALFGLVQALLLTRHMLFVGYSLTDEDFHQLVHEVRVARTGVPGAGRLGTALTLFDDPLFDDLWSDDIHIVPVADAPRGAPDAGEVGEAARHLQILCDLIAFEAADLDAFLLDPTYAALLDPDEEQLAARLRPLMDVGSTSVSGELTLPAVARLERLLGELGARRAPG